MRPEERKPLLAVTHLITLGFVEGRSRHELGLQDGGTDRIVTDMAELGFEAKTHSACVVSLHPGIRLQELKENTGFTLHIPKSVPTTALSTAEELRRLRGEIDPKRGGISGE